MHKKKAIALAMSVIAIAVSITSVVLWWCNLQKAGDMQVRMERIEAQMMRN